MDLRATSSAWQGSVLPSTPKKRWRQGAESGKGTVNRIKFLTKAPSWLRGAEMRKDLLFSLKEEKVAIS